MDFFGESTGLYFYSAVFQGSVSLVGLLAIFIVFRLQQFDTDIRILEDDVSRKKHDSFSSIAKAKLFNPKGVHEEDSLQVKGIKDGLEIIADLQVGITKLAKEGRDYRIKQRAEFGKRSRRPLIVSALPSILSALLLLFTTNINKHFAWQIEGLFFFLTLFVLVYALITIFRFVVSTASATPHLPGQDIPYKGEVNAAAPIPPQAREESSLHSE